MVGSRSIYLQNPIQRAMACKFNSWPLYCLLIFLSNPVYAYVLQIIVAANHMSGKDTHVRGLRVLGPLE